MDVELKDSENLVIAFTGFANKLMAPTKMFMSDAGFADYSKIILNDPSKTMFLCGVPGVFDSFNHLIEKLQAQINQIKPKNLIVLGTSGGGHSALLLGHILKANVCVVFAPYPYLSDQEFIRLTDPALHTFHQVLERVRKSPKEVLKYLNAKDTIQEWNGVTEFFIHVSEGHEWDVKRANTLAGIPHLTIIKHPGNAHTAISAKFLKLGLLRHCFKLDQEAFFKQTYSPSRPITQKRYY